MEDRSSENERRIGSVKAAISRYGGKVNQSTNMRKTDQKDASDLLQETGSKAPELHLAKKTFDKISENRRITETVTSQAELELLKAKKVVRELTSQIEESKLKGNDQRVRKPFNVENCQDIEVARELEFLKREVSKVKLEIERVSEEKSRAEKDADAADLKLEFYLKTAEKLRRDIEEANEEEVLVELAQIQARKELAAIEAQKKEEEETFSSKVREVRKKTNFLRKDVEQVKKLEDVLEITKSEADVLQFELNMIKEMDQRISSNGNSATNNPEVQTVIKDLETATKEHASIKAGVFQIMSSMDTIRIELNNILEEKGKIEKGEAKTEKYLKKLNLKLLRAKDKLESAKAYEEKAKLMLPSFTVSLQELEKVKEATEKERKCITEEVERIRNDIQETESKTDLTEGKLLEVMQELETVKNEEANALKKLKFMVERTVVDRASKNTDTITLSKFEYDYLKGSAAGAEELANKKMEAANAWAEALRANVKEMEIMTEMANREIKDLKVKEERELNEMEKLLNETEMAELEMKKSRDQDKKSVRGRRSVVENSYSLTPVKQMKFRQSISSPAARRPVISTFWTVKRKRKAMGKNGSSIANENTENEKTSSLEETQ